jgi:hypothetical protein
MTGLEGRVVEDTILNFSTAGFSNISRVLLSPVSFVETGEDADNDLLKKYGKLVRVKLVDSRSPLARDRQLTELCFIGVEQCQRKPITMRRLVWLGGPIPKWSEPLTARSQKNVIPIRVWTSQPKACGGFG